MIQYLKNLNWQKLAKITTILTTINIVFSFSICLFKYLTYQYNCLDLAIFNQVFYNSSLGQFFQFTIHPTSYLGDHFAPIIIVLLPLYYLYRSPLTLLLIQSVFLALAAIPLYLICKRQLTPLQSLLIIILYLFNPVTLNIALFEFHLLALIPFFIFWTFYFYQQKKYRLFMLLGCLSLIIREDVSFIIFMFGLIALLERRTLKWILGPGLLALIYFFTALKIVAHFSSAASYKFLVYYQWLGESLWEIPLNFFLRFPQVLAHVFTVAHLELILGFLLVFLFIPLWRPKYLLLSLGMFMQILLGFGSGELILRTHYGSTFLTAATLATVYSLPALIKNQKFQTFYQKRKDLVFLVMTTAIIYNFLILGPLISFGQKIITTDYQQVALKNDFISEIPATASAVTSYDLIANLSSRPQIYSLNYLFLNSQQYGAGEYTIPDETQYLLINFNDFITFNFQYNVGTAKKYYDQGYINLTNILAKDYQLVKAEKNLALWQKNAPANDLQLFSTDIDLAAALQNQQPVELSPEIKFLGLKQNEKTALYFQARQTMADNYFIIINKQTYPLGYGLLPTSAWAIDRPIQINFYQLGHVSDFTIIKLQGGIELDNLGSVRDVIDEQQVIGQWPPD